MGRRPTPTALKVIRGNPGQRPLNDNEPIAPRADLRAPDGLGEVGKAVWEEIVPLLDRMGVFTQADRLTIFRYCLLQEEFAKVVAHVRDHGMTQLTETGYSQLTAEGSLFRTLPADLLKIEREFGMTAAARSTLKSTPLHAESTKSSLAAFLKRG